MSNTVTFDLTEPVVDHTGPVRRVVLREPRASDFFALGEPTTMAQTRDGSVYIVDNDAAIQGYVDRCIVEPKSAAALEQMCLADALRLKGAVLGFFVAAKARTSSTPATTSSPPSAGPTPLPAAD